MPRTGNTTSPIDSTVDDGGSEERAARAVPALTIAWALAEPHRVGEVAIFSGSGRSFLGRGGDDELDQVVFARVRPGVVERTGSLAGNHLSRRQIAIEVSGDDVEIENVGKLRMSVNGVEKKRATLAAGDVVSLHRHSAFVFGLRPARMPKLGADYPPCGFGEPDAFGIVGESAACWEMREQLALLARFDEHTLVLGESGTGKELAARAVHALSRRARGPFVARNAATIPDALVEAEVYGNRKDFPNAGMPESDGLIGAARGGTLFLDEIAEITAARQAPLLRVFDRDGSYHRLGDPKPRKADVRFVCATNRSPGELKSDFAARLTLRVELPPLDARREDIALVARHVVLDDAQRNPDAVGRFVRRDGRRPEIAIDPAFLLRLLRLEYPTNVRDLVRVLRQSVTASRGDVLEAPPNLDDDRSGVVAVSDASAGISEADMRLALERQRWNLTHAAEQLGITRYKLMRLMRKYGLRDAG